MTDKNKRLENYFKKRGIKGFLKPVDNLENSQLVIVENKRCASKISLVKTEYYKTLLERGETYPPDLVHFLIHTNKRNVQNIKNSIITPRYMEFFKFNNKKT